MMNTDLIKDAKEWMDDNWFFEEGHEKIDSLIHETVEEFKAYGDSFTDDELDHLADWLWDRMNEYEEEEEERNKTYNPDDELDRLADIRYERMRDFRLAM